MPDESPQRDDADRQRYTGNSIIFVRQPIPSAIPVVALLRAMLPPWAPKPLVQELRLLPERRLIARLHVRPDQLNLNALREFGFDDDMIQSRVAVAPERHLYLNPPRLESGPFEKPGAKFTWGIEKIGITGDPSEPTGKGAIVAVLDTGIDLRHPDFKLRIRKRDVRSFIDLSAQDIGGHGTHCAGIIGGPATAKPRYSVAPDVRLLIGNIYEAGTTSSFDWALVAGLCWAARKGAHIVSLSLGTPLDDRCQEHEKAFEWFFELLLDAFGLVIVAASGNGARRPVHLLPIRHPANCPSVVAVPAVDSTPEVAEFSCGQECHQREPTISGPGVSICSASVVTSTTSPLYVPRHGTSQAAPFVAGVAALWYEKGKRGRDIIRALQSKFSAAAGGPAAVGKGLVHIP